MTDTELSVAASADQPPIVAGPPSPVERKAKRNATWARWAGIFIAIAAAVRVAAFFLPHTLADCDGSDLQSSLRSTIETTSKVKLTSVSNIQTVSRSDNSAICRMHVNVADGSQADITYQLDLVKGDTNFRVTTVK